MTGNNFILLALSLIFIKVSFNSFNEYCYFREEYLHYFSSDELLLSELYNDIRFERA